MAHLSAFYYALPCTNRAKIYFPDGFRKGLFLRFDHSDGHYGIGELAPLVGIHTKTLDDLIPAIQKNLPIKKLNKLFSLSGENLADLVLFFDQFSYPFSYALSMIYFHHTLQKDLKSLKNALPLAALVEETSLADAITLAHNYAAQGYTCLKIKIGHLHVDDEIKKIKIIASLVGKCVSLRLDANRKLSFEDACRLLTALRKINIEYIEEPFPFIDRAKDLFHHTGVNVAIDESNMPPFHVDNLCDMGINVVIMKPSRFKSIYHVIDCAKKAISLGIKPVLSHCFESEFSSSIYASMIHKLDLLKHAHGIIAEGFFKQNVLKNPLRSFRGQLFFDVDKISPNQFWRMPLKQIF